MAVVTARNGLSESLEEYAYRAGVHKNKARFWWRVQGVEFLLGATMFTNADGCRVAPGVAVPIPGLTPADVLEGNHDFTTITAPDGSAFERGPHGDHLRYRAKVVRVRRNAAAPA